ncbi:MAG: hypothetical protein ABIP94_12665 [Planctomycetota bacterium]
MQLGCQCLASAPFGSILRVCSSWPLATHDSAGRASFRMQVPAQPSLVGLTIYWQALSGALPKLGNLEVTTLLTK